MHKKYKCLLAMRNQAGESREQPRTAGKLFRQMLCEACRKVHFFAAGRSRIALQEDEQCYHVTYLQKLGGIFK